jgi:hypothetical protein
MINRSELNEHAARLTRQINLIGAELGINEIIQNAEAIEQKFGELKNDNIRLTSENEELMGSLKSLISSVESIRWYENPDNFQDVGKKLDAILEMARARFVPTEARTSARIGDVAEIMAMPIEGRAEPPAAKDPIPLGLRRGPHNPGQFQT